MSSEEEKQILKMVEEGRISAEEAVQLMKALETPAEAQAEVVEPEEGARSAAETDPPFAEIAANARRLWMIPLWVGVGVTVLGAGLMYWAMQASGFGFWFYCAWLPFLLGVAVITLAWASRTGRWIFVDIKQKAGKKPGRIVIGLPLSLKLAAWFLRTFGHNIPDLQKTAADEMLLALEQSTSSDSPIIAHIDEAGDEHVERVRVFIG